MTADLRHAALGLAVGLLAALTIAGLAGAAAARAAAPGSAAAVDARVVSTFVMSGRIVTAVRVRGEHPGQLITRRWEFSGQRCAGNVCSRLALRRERSAHRFSRIVLTRVAVGRYLGRARFYAALRCRGRLYPRGEVVPYRITVRITRATPVESIAFASQLAASYTNTRRIDRTRCPLGPSHDAAVYTGAASPLPSPPTPAFTATVDPATDDGRFADTSVPGAGGAPIVARTWQFGDPASGSADTATTAVATHLFSAPGTYTVTLTVRDANGLAAIAAETVTAPGPPAASFSAAPAGAPLTVAFQTRRHPGSAGRRWWPGTGCSAIRPPARPTTRGCRTRSTPSAVRARIACA